MIYYEDHHYVIICISAAIVLYCRMACAQIISSSLVLFLSDTESYMLQMKMRRNQNQQPVAAVGPRPPPAAQQAVEAHTYTCGSFSRSCCPRLSSMAPASAGWTAARVSSR
jgi:hypothetical protein